MPPGREHNNVNAMIVKRNWKQVSSELKHPQKNNAYYQKIVVSYVKLSNRIESNRLFPELECSTWGRFVVLLVYLFFYYYRNDGPISKHVGLVTMV